MGKPGEFFIQPRGAGRVAAPADHNLQGAESELQCGTGVRAAASVRPGRVKSQSWRGKSTAKRTNILKPTVKTFLFF